MIFTYTDSITSTTFTSFNYFKSW